MFTQCTQHPCTLQFFSTWKQERSQLINGKQSNLYVMNLVTTHYYCHHPWTTFPIMHCTHTFPSTITPITQLSPFTHHSDCLTTPAPHSLTLIKAAHNTHPVRSLVSPWLHFRAYFSVCLSVHYLDCWPPLLIVCCLPLWPRLFHGNPLCLPPALTIALSLFSTLPFLRCPRHLCLILPVWPCTNKAASGSTLASDLSSVTEDFAEDESSSKIDVTPPGYKVHWGLCRRLPRTGTPYSLWQSA